MSLRLSRGRSTARHKSDQGELKQIRDLVDGLELPSPWTVEGVVEAVSRRVQRPLLLHPLDDLPPEISGVSLPVGDVDDAYVVCYDSRVPGWSQLMIVLHELGHHLLHHLPRYEQCLSSQAFASTLPASARPQQSVGMARTSFTDPREVDAERFATLMADRLERLQRAELSPQLQGIRRGIEPPHRWSR
jgi:hypothetical protein